MRVEPESFNAPIMNQPKEEETKNPVKRKESAVTLKSIGQLLQSENSQQSQDYFNLGYRPYFVYHISG